MRRRRGPDGFAVLQRQIGGGLQTREEIYDRGRRLFESFFDHPRLREDDQVYVEFLVGVAEQELDRGPLRGIVRRPNALVDKTTSIECWCRCPAIRSTPNARVVRCRCGFAPPSNGKVSSNSIANGKPSSLRQISTAGRADVSVSAKSSMIAVTRSTNSCTAGKAEASAAVRSGRWLRLLSGPRRISGFASHVEPLPARRQNGRSMGLHTPFADFTQF